MRTCVIFNPTAKGDKARHFRQHLDEIGAESTLRLTTAPGDARRLAAQAVSEGFEVVVAAGGDGTLNEVVNGLAAVPETMAQVCLGLLPLGTVNVFARELQLPTNLRAAWDVIRHGTGLCIDLPFVEFGGPGGSQRRCFAQMAGAGLDARAIERVNWSLKKKIGPLAYVLAGCQAMLEAAPMITASGPGWSEAGELVLVGNGRLYGGDFHVFPGADLRDGLLEICVFKKANWLSVARCGPALLLNRKLPESLCRRFQSPTFELSSPSPAPLELDGELAGHLPAKFSIGTQRLRVLVPA